MEQSVKSSLALGSLLLVGLLGMAWIGGNSLLKAKEYERRVSVKGLSEKEVQADVVVWPIRFSGASNELPGLYGEMGRSAAAILAYLKLNGVAEEEILIAPPAVTDKLAQPYGGAETGTFRYTAAQTITVRSGQVDRVRQLMNGIAELGQQGIAFAGQDYQQTEFIFTKLNELKPLMVEEATRSAREVADKFAKDSASRLGKIRTANQGQFTVENRDSSTPYIKKVRVVSTVEYYLSD
ncbi:SIMPL domain-containing protein [Aeromonas bivalvium]|uniref:SIMPL domain-containing protein n=1 Tax=Aeromonas TaxID=642 RepID=UPI0038D0CBD8